MGNKDVISSAKGHKKNLSETTGFYVDISFLFVFN